MRKTSCVTFLSVLCLGVMVAGASASPTIADLLAAADQEKTAGHWDEALKGYEAARQAADRSRDETSQAAALLGMADAEFQNGHYDNTARLAAESLAISEKIGALAAQADALKLIGNVQYENGDPTERATAERVLAIREKLGDRPGIAIALNNLGTAYRLVDPLKAIDYFDRSQRELDRLGDGRRRSTVLNNIGLGYQDLGDYARAVEYCREALDLAEKNDDPRRIGVALNALGVTETYRGDYPAALALYERALQVDSKAGYTWAMAEVVNNTGLVYQAQRNHSQAMAYFSRALELDRKLGDRTLEAEVENNLAHELFALGRYAESLRRFGESLALCRRFAYRGLASDTLTGLARVHARLGRLREAAGEADEAIEIARAVLDPRRLADALAQSAFLRLESGRPAEALAVAREAISAASSIENPETLWQAELAAGKALRSLHRNSEAADAFDRSIVTIESQRSRVTGPPDSLPLYFADKIEPYQERVALFLADGRVDEALRLVEASKSRVLFDLLRSGRVQLDGALRPDERARERGVKDELASLNFRIAKKPDDADLRATREEKRRDLEALQTTLYAEHPELAFRRGAESSPSAREMTLLASQNHAVLLDYFVTPARTYLFVIKPGAARRVSVLPIRGRELARKTVELRRELASHDLSFASNARELYRLLLAPVERDLEANDAVVIIPDGPLWGVSFPALQPRSGHFVIEDLAVSYAPSLAVLRETQRIAKARVGKPAPLELLALGNPATGSPLPEAERQVLEIQKLYGAEESRVLTGEAASEDRFKAEAGRFRILHLACHAVLDDVNPMYSRILLAKGNGNSGELEARELMNLDLNAEMLVLSGCETARGAAASGEGITGMLWAAFAAGAPTTVASLWRVESASTSELMIEFHRQWLVSRGKGLPFSKAEALRAAARKLIASSRYAHPFYWAGFILAGSPG